MKPMTMLIILFLFCINSSAFSAEEVTSQRDAYDIINALSKASPVQHSNLLNELGPAIKSSAGLPEDDVVSMICVYALGRISTGDANKGREVLKYTIENWPEHKLPPLLYDEFKSDTTGIEKAAWNLYSKLLKDLAQDLDLKQSNTTGPQITLLGEEEYGIGRKNVMVVLGFLDEAPPVSLMEEVARREHERVRGRYEEVTISFHYSHDMKRRGAGYGMIEYSPDGEPGEFRINDWVLNDHPIPPPSFPERDESKSPSKLIQKPYILIDHQKFELLQIVKIRLVGQVPEDAKLKELSTDLRNWHQPQDQFDVEFYVENGGNQKRYALWQSFRSGRTSFTRH